MSSWKRRPKLNVIQFPLRGRWLQAALRKAISEAGGRPILTSELAEAVGGELRSKLSETFLKALSEDFASNGIEVIEKVRSERPHEYLKIVAAVLPKQMQLEDLTPKRRAEDLTDDDLATFASGGNA
jgi:hypothetical protein